MSEFEKQLQEAPHLEVRRAHQDATVSEALGAFHRRQDRKRMVVPFITSFLGAAAAFAIAAVFLLNRGTPQDDAPEPVSRDMMLQAYVELREIFPEGLAAIALVNGEMQIYPGLAASRGPEPTYVEMMIGSSMVKVVATQGATLPLEVNGATVSVEFMPDASGDPMVVGEDFYWSPHGKLMPMDRKVLQAERMDLFL